MDNKIPSPAAIRAEESIRSEYVVTRPFGSVPEEGSIARLIDKEFYPIVAALHKIMSDPKALAAMSRATFLTARDALEGKQ